MNKLSMRTKGIIFVVFISLVSLVVAGAGNYLSVKKALIKSETEKTSSNLSILANNLSSWMAVRQAEVLVMSRTDVVRFGTDSEKLVYFGRELLRSDFTFHIIGFINKKGEGISSDGAAQDMSNVPFFEQAIKGEVVVTDPDIAVLSNAKQSVIAVPVYGERNEIVGVVYATILYATLQPYTQSWDEEAGLYLINNYGAVMYGEDPHNSSISSGRYINGQDSILQPVSSNVLSEDSGSIHFADQINQEFVVFYENVDSVPWRFVFVEPASKLEVKLRPIFWRIVNMITIAEIVIVLFISLFFHRIIKRLEQILHVTEQAAGGSLHAVHLDESVGDEIGQLARSVNGMMVRLQASFDQLSAIINQNQYGFIVMDDQYKITYLNETAEQLLGYDSKELVGHATPLHFLDLEQVKERARQLSEQLGREVLPGLDVFKELRNEHFSYETEWTVIRKDGNRVPTLYSSNGLRDLNGRFTGVVVMLIDITERKQVENARNRLLTIVESAKDLIISADMGGNLIYSNQSGYEKLDLNADEDIIGHNIKEYLPPDMQTMISQGVVIANEKGYWEGEVQFIRKNNEVVDASLVVVVHRDEVSGELYYSTIARDITEQKHVHEQLVRARQEAEEANEAKSRFLALMSHEIRTPLNGIMGLTGLMLKTELLPYQKDYMDKISTSSETLLRIINDVLDFSKIEAGKIDIERHPFQPSLLLRRMTDQLSVFMGGKEQFELMLDTPAYEPQTLMGDSLRLEQVLLNLCINAIKFTERGMVKLKIELIKMVDDQAIFQFSISDTGIGMSKEQLSRLFKPFTQADGSTTRKFGGTGLGLVISKSFVELMGGQLEVESELGVGSRFFFTLGFDVIQRNAGQRWEASEAAINQPVWIVEDNDAMREHWCAIVEAFGMSPIAFDSWKQVTDRLARIGKGAAPMLLLADMEMPDMYGMDTWLELQQSASLLGIKTIAMTTTYGRDEMLLLPEENRPLMILVKPITRAIMLQALSRATEASDELELQYEATDMQHTDSQQVSRARILLAEDNRINQLVSIEMLKELGYEYGLAKNGEEVLSMLEEGHWDLILMDIHMPVLDGSEATRIIRSQSKYDHIPIIAVTANSLKADHEKYLKQGISAVVTKPVDIQYLEVVINSAISHMVKLNKRVQAADGYSATGGQELYLKGRLMNTASAASVIALDEVLERIQGKERILIQMLKQFIRDYSTFVVELQETIERTDIRQAARMLHTLKGASGNLSAHGVFAAAADYEQLLKQSFTKEEQQGAASRLGLEMSKLIEVISNNLKTIGD